MNTHIVQETVETVAGYPAAKFGVLKISMSLLFFLFFAYDVWEVIESALELTKFLTLEPLHWALLAVLMVAPMILWVLANLLGRKLRAHHFALLLFVALCTSSLVFSNLNYLLQALIMGLL
ncbi:MAG: hypothetical protein WBA28_09240 [Microbacteriaceae bacterium]